VQKQPRVPTKNQYPENIIAQRLSKQGARVQVQVLAEGGVGRGMLSSLPFQSRTVNRVAELWGIRVAGYVQSRCHQAGPLKT
jgi:hypothetical protein